MYADRTVYNGGREGERSGGIAARQQGVPARTAVERVTIPASGFVDVQFSDEVFFRTGPRSLVAGTLKGVAGEMARLGETGTTHRFTRTSPGAATDVPINTAFYPAAGPEYRGADVIIWAGHNDAEGPGGLADDITPSSLRAPGSDGHLNATGYDVLAQYIYDAYVSQRW